MLSSVTFSHLVFLKNFIRVNSAVFVIFVTFGQFTRRSLEHIGDFFGNAAIFQVVAIIINKSLFP